MWWILPLIITFVAVTVVMTCRRVVYDDWGLVVSGMVCVLVILAWSICPPLYYESRGQAWAAEEYWKSVIEPNVIEEHEDYVVVSDVESAIWQAGNDNLIAYNSLLRSNRYWMEVPVIQWNMYPLPVYLKYARVGSR